MATNEEPQEIPTWKYLKDIYLAKKQGEALERSTKPTHHYEGIGLGYFGPQTVLALGALDLFEDMCNRLASSEIKVVDNRGNETTIKHIIRNNELHIFTEEIGVASGSRNAKRLEKGLETIGQLGQYLPFTKRDRQDPEKVDLND